MFEITEAVRDAASLDFNNDEKILVAMTEEEAERIRSLGDDEFSFVFEDGVYFCEKTDVVIDGSVELGNDELVKLAKEILVDQIGDYIN